jgi:hypothetical protein
MEKIVFTDSALKVFGIKRPRLPRKRKKQLKKRWYKLFPLITKNIVIKP